VNTSDQHDGSSNRPATSHQKSMAEHVPHPELEIDYEGLGGGSLMSNLLAGAFAGIMVFSFFFGFFGFLGWF
jgi:predicted lipid-binding transport protein (Tim44 family)